MGVIAEALGRRAEPEPAWQTAPLSTAPVSAASGPSPMVGPNDLVITINGQEHRIAASSVASIGRDPDNTVVVDSQAVSRRHAQVQFVGGRWEFRDLGSTQGSFVRGTAVTSTMIDGSLEVVLGQGADAAPVQLTPSGAHAAVSAPAERLRPIHAPATEIVGGLRPGGALGAGGAPATELVGGPTAEALTVTLGSSSRVLHPGQSLTIGREDDNDLVATQSTVSRHHARIEHTDNTWRLRDLGRPPGLGS